VGDTGEITLRKKRRFQKLQDGRYSINLPTEERVLLKILPNQLLESLTALSDALSDNGGLSQFGELGFDDAEKIDLGLHFENLSPEDDAPYTLNDFDIPEPIKRLIPTAYPRDEQAQENFSALTAPHLLKEHIDRLTSLSGVISNQYVTGEELNEWVIALNDLRLVLGTSIGVTENSAMPDMSDPLIPQWVAYSFLSELVEEIISVLFSEIPDSDEENDPPLPEDPWGEAPGGLRWDGTTRPNGPM
jgi:hypothetical protein